MATFAQLLPHLCLHVNCQRVEMIFATYLIARASMFNVQRLNMADLEAPEAFISCYFSSFINTLSPAECLFPS